MDQFDHRSLGPRLDLFHFRDDAPGMPFWHPDGYAVYRVLEDYLRERMRRLGFGEVRTPQLLPRSLWERSGHWDKFGHAMFRVDDPDRPMALKPMSCPCHVGIFNSRPRSWRDLPLRYAEFGACHRNEPSGSMHGLMRTRSFEQDDAHVLCREDQAGAEIARFVRLLKEVYRDLGFPELSVALSTRPAVRAGDDALWDRAEAALAEALSSCGLAYDVQPGEGAFYGPKAEFALKDGMGRSWQCGTVQLDYVLPGNLGASYVAPDGGPAVPVMIHHAVLGSMGRFVGILLEHHAGALPFWLSPRQVAVLPVSDLFADYAREVNEAFLAEGVRSRVLAGGDTLQRRIVESHADMDCVMAVVGAREVRDRSVALRERGGARSQSGLDEAVFEMRRRGASPGHASSP